MAHWLVVDATTYEVISAGSSSSSEIPAAPAGALNLPVSANVLRTIWAPEDGPIDLVALKADLCNKIDSECGAIRRMFITDITGQNATYQLKLAEANAWTSGDDPADYPYLGREATKRGMTMDALVAEVLATASMWVGTIDPELESSRVAAKKDVLAAADVQGAISASFVDWEALLS